MALFLGDMSEMNILIAQGKTARVDQLLSNDIRIGTMHSQKNKGELLDINKSNNKVAVQALLLL